MKLSEFLKLPEVIEAGISKSSPVRMVIAPHGMWLAASNALKALKTIQETNIPAEAVYLGSDALLQIVGLSRTPQALKPKLRRLYANINLHLFEIANVTGQRKEDIVIWIEGASSPADKLGKFDIDKDTVEKWIGLANQVLRPDFLQQNPNRHLNRLIHKSKEKLK